MKAVNPATGELIREYPDHDDAQVDEILARAETAFTSWRKVPLRRALAPHDPRGGPAARPGRDFGRLMTEEMGKTVAAAEGGRQVRMGLRFLRRARRALPRRRAGENRRREAM